MKLIRSISLLFLVLFLNTSYGQSWTGQAYDFYKSKDYENAKSFIDSAITSVERFDSQTWQLRGIIYRNVSTGDQLYYREIALESFVTAKKIDSTGIYTDKINKYLESTLIRYYNDAVSLLIDENEFEKSEKSYDIYKKEYKKLLNPIYDFRITDINYYNAMGVEYLKKTALVEQNKKNTFQEKSLYYFQKVLKIDSLDYKANFNMGVVYYNRGADYVMVSDPEITIDILILNLQKSESAFMIALPYLHRAEKLKPHSLEVQEALMGCYYGLHKNDLYLKYQTLVDQHNLQGFIDLYKAEPKNEDNIRNLIRIYTQTLLDEEKANFYKNVLYELKNP